MRIDVICVKIENPGNLGAIARIVKNFGIHDLTLIDPQCDPRSSEAIARSKHAKDVLEKARITDFSVFEEFDCLVGTTSALGTDYNIPRSPISPEDLSGKIKNLDDNTTIGIVFGPEGTGLSNEILKEMDFTVTIPTHKDYPVLNLSHSIAILLYELYKEHGKDRIGQQIEPCGRAEKEVLLKKISALLDTLDFATPEKKDTQEIVWKKIIGKAMPTKREAFALLGFFKKIEDAIKKK